MASPNKTKNFTALVGNVHKSYLCERMSKLTLSMMQWALIAHKASRLFINSVSFDYLDECPEGIITASGGSDRSWRALECRSRTNRLQMKENRYLSPASSFGVAPSI